MLAGLGGVGRVGRHGSVTRAGVVARPALDFNFMSGVIPAPLVFTRASVASYMDAAGVIQTVGNDVPRFDYDPITHALCGLLIEETRTNLLLNSSTLVTQNVTTTAVLHTLSFYGTGSITYSGAASGTLASAGAFPARAAVTFTPAAGTLTLTVTGQVLNAQLEADRFATSWIPTAAASATRTLEVASMPTGAWFNPAKLTVAAEWITQNIPEPTVRNRHVFGISDGTPSNRYTLAAPVFFTTSLRSITTISGGAGISAITANAITAGAISKGATTWDGTTNTTVLNGGAPVSIAAGTPIGQNVLAIGNHIVAGAGSANSFQGWIRSVRLWPRVMSTGEMQQVTTVVDPSLTLDYTSGALPSGMTFTRAGTATYFDATGVMQTAAVNTPRIDYDPDTHAINGLLIEDAVANLWLNSGDVNQWVKAGVPTVPTVTPNVTTAPDGTLTAGRVGFPATDAATYSTVQQAITTSVVTQYTFSVWMKGVTGNETVYIQIANGIVLNNFIACKLTTRWKRFSITSIGMLAAQAWQPAIGSDTRSGDQLGLPTQSIYVWGGQFEQGTILSSYIPTTAAAVTRAVDAMSTPVGPWFNPLASTLCGEFKQGVGGGGRVVCNISNGNTDNFIAISGGSGGNLVRSCAAITAITNVVTTTINLNSGVPPGTVGKTAASWDGTTVSVSGNGCAPVSASMGMPTGLTLLTLGNHLPTNNNVLNGWVRRVQYWPRALSPTELLGVSG